MQLQITVKASVYTGKKTLISTSARGFDDLVVVILELNLHYILYAGSTHAASQWKKQGKNSLCVSKAYVLQTWWFFTLVGAYKQS